MEWNEIAVMEKTFMKLLAVIGTVGLFLLFGTPATFAAQDRPESDKPEKQESKPEAKPDAKPEAKPEARPEAKPAAKPESKPAAKPAREEAKPKQQVQDKPVQQQKEQKTEQSKGNEGKSGGGAHGRISDDHYRASFGSGHNFHVSQGDYGNHRFNYGGYSFGFVDAWPVGWYYTDEVYVVYDDGGYYMYDVVHPGIRISVNIL
jgi:hypothetical protein